LLQTAPDGASESNPTLLTGDFISVPEQQARVTILGAVAKSGTVDLPEGKTLRVSDALAAAGGLTLAPRAARIGIARYLPGGRLVPIDIDANALLVENDLSQDATLREDDLITVSAIKIRTLFVTGQVNRPGPVDSDPSEGLTQLLARAGGPAPGAALRKVTVTRRGALVASVDMLDAVKGGATPTVELQDGDYINVARNEARVVIMPAVRVPGVYPIPEDRPLTIGDALSLAGGPQAGAKLKEVVIFRETPQGVTKQLVSLTPKPGASLPTNIVLQDKDFLYVPEGDRNRTNLIDTGLRAFSAFSFLLR
jgi:protein involved in polysaccharide export with SLBB domain